MFAKWRENRGGDHPEYVPPPPMPFGGEHVWGYFISLNRERSWDELGPEPFNSQLLYFWQIRSKVKLKPWEEEAIYKIDEAYRAHAIEQAKKR